MPLPSRRRHLSGNIGKRSIGRTSAPLKQYTGCNPFTGVSWRSMKAKTLLRNLERLNLPQTTIQEVMAKPEEMPDLNREQLYQFGQTSAGSKLRPYKRDKYARRKNRMNPRPGFGTPDFYLTGAFQKSIRVQELGGNVVLNATDFKTPFLAKRDPELFGLTDENMSRYRKALFPRIMRNVNRQVKKK